jgi:C1A family cysteine protease
MNSEEFSKLMGFNENKKISYNLRGLNNIDSISFNAQNVESIPSSIDWREKNAVTDVKDQGQCGSCWTFSTTGALEGIYSIKYGNLESFSEQQLVDCDNFRNGGNSLGCNGGDMGTAMDWITKNGGLCSEDEYPYISGTTKTSGSCDKTCDKISGSKITSHVSVTPNSDYDLMKALSQQPVSVAIEADQKVFQLYNSGILTGDVCGDDLDHGVLVVGYGSEDGVDYYIVKNSWSDTWGDNGYIRLERNADLNNGSGQCGILSQPVYPLL